MNRLYYVTACTDSWCFRLACNHEHATVTSATACIACPGGYVVTVEDGGYRALNDAEEAEFQQARYGNKTIMRYEAPGAALLLRMQLTPEVVAHFGVSLWLNEESTT